MYWKIGPALSISSISWFSFCRLVRFRRNSLRFEIMMAVCSVLLLFPVPGLPQTLEKNKPPDNYSYQNQAPQGPIEDLKALATNLILPNIPGAIMLFVLSSLFSSINFYSTVRSNRRSFRVALRYLIAWVSFNYLFALLVLLLILPNDLSLSEISKTLFVYCLVATAMPEIAANLRLQLGNSANAIDLYKYKTKVSDLITEYLGTSVAEQQSKELMALAFYYYGRLDQFLDKLAIFRNQENLTDEEIAEVKELAEKLKAQPVDGRVRRVLKLEREHHKIIPKLIQFFRSDIQNFAASPVADLMRKLQPVLVVDEARKLVEAGVTSSRRFLWRCRFKPARKRIATTTGISEKRLDVLYYTTRTTERKRKLSGFKWMGAIAIIIVVIISAFYVIQFRSLVEFKPDEDLKSQIASIPLNEDALNVDFRYDQEINPAPPAQKDISQ